MVRRLRWAGREVVRLAKVRASATRIYLDAYDLSGSLNTAALNIDQPEIPIPTFTDGQAALIDNYRTASEVAGFGEFADNLIDERIHALVGDDTDHYLLTAFMGIAENAVVYEQAVRLTRKINSAAVGAVQLLSAGFVGASGLYRGLSLRQGTITGNGNGTGRNLGATVAGQVFAVTYRVISGTFVSFDLKIQESSDDGAGDAYADVAGLTQSFNAVGVARDEVTIATEAWKRVVVANWNGTSAVILVTAGAVAA